MTQEFEPMRLRTQYQDWLLEFLNKNDVGSIALTARSHFSKLLVGNLVEAFLIGMAGPVRAILDRQLKGMLSVPEPQRAQFHGSARGERIWLEHLYEWRQLLGLCKWLAGEPAERELTAAVAADWQGMQSLPEAEALEHRNERCQGMGLRLATALAGDVPRMGLDMLAACKTVQHYIPAAPLLGFGGWACHHLSTGGRRDQEFLSRGIQALTATLLPVLLPNSSKREIGLWLKAVYFDSGVAKSAEETMMLAYECMPGVRRPQFD